MTRELPRLAVLVACFNRKTQSLASISAVLDQASAYFRVHVFAYDSDSSDGTAAALAALDERITVTPGSAQSYWASSMAAVAASALEWAPNFIMLLNDDLELYPNTFEEFARQIGSLSAEAASKIVMVGEVEDVDGQIIYGARTQVATDPFDFQLNQSRNTAIDTFNGNFVVLGTQAFEAAGGFPRGFKHHYADFVLGLRLRRAGITMTRLSNIVGRGAVNLNHSPEKNVNISMSKRIRFALSPFGLPPREQWTYCVEVDGRRNAPLNFLRSYRYVLFPRS